MLMENSKGVKFENFEVKLNFIFNSNNLKNNQNFEFSNSNFERNIISGKFLLRRKYFFLF